jgi:hypothetical protein
MPDIIGNTDKKAFTALQKICMVLGSLLFVFLIFYSIMNYLAPGKKLKEIEEKIITKSSGNSVPDKRFYSDSAFIRMSKEKAYLQARISMAETDSIYMTINIPDSTISLGISGVEVHSVKIPEMKISSILRSGNEYIISSLFSTPMNIVNDLSTIKKEPLMIKMAPKDTSEFKPDIIPDTTDYEPVNYILEMDSGIRIYIYQQTDTVTRDKNRLFYFDLNDRLKGSWSSIKSVMHLKVPEYHPFIRIKLPKADAKIIYRAIPRQGQIAVYL